MNKYICQTNDSFSASYIHQTCLKEKPLPFSGERIFCLGHTESMIDRYGKEKLTNMLNNLQNELNKTKYNYKIINKRTELLIIQYGRSDIFNCTARIY